MKIWHHAGRDSPQLHRCECLYALILNVRAHGCFASFCKGWVAEATPLGFFAHCRDIDKIKKIKRAQTLRWTPIEFLYHLPDPRRGSYLPSFWVNTVLCLQASMAGATAFQKQKFDEDRNKCALHFEAEEDMVSSPDVPRILLIFTK